MKLSKLKLLALVVGVANVQQTAMAFLSSASAPVSGSATNNNAANGDNGTGGSAFDRGLIGSGNGWTTGAAPSPTAKTAPIQPAYAGMVNLGSISQGVKNAAWQAYLNGNNFNDAYDAGLQVLKNEGYDVNNPSVKVAFNSMLAAFIRTASANFIKYGSITVPAWAEMLGGIAGVFMVPGQACLIMHINCPRSGVVY